MKRPFGSLNHSRSKKAACTVSAAALMLGVSSAATIGLHFQESYCAAPAYSGFVVTLTAFGVPPGSWENLAPMPTGYGCGSSNALGYSNSAVIDTSPAANGLNPIPNGSLNVSWFGPTANYDPFGGYVAGTPPNYYHPGGAGGAQDVATNPVTGEEQIYSAFLRDGVNFGPGESGGNNNQPGYYVDITGLKSLFTNSSFVVEVMASSDSMETLTNAYVIDMSDLATNSVSYPNTPPVSDAGDTSWIRGIGGGLSTGSAPLNTDHIYITSAPPEHGGNKPGGYNHAGTISGFIITDKPVVSMNPQSIPLAGPGDVIALSAYAIGVPPLSYQWQLNGKNLPGATALSYTFTNITLADGGNYTLVVTNVYGATTSAVATVTSDSLVQNPTNGVVYDSNPTGVQHNGVNMGATWEASDSDGSVTETGVMNFVAEQTNGITVEDAPAFDGPTGTIAFWMRSAGTDQNAPGSTGASLFCRPSTNSADFVIAQFDGSPGNIYVTSPGTVLNFSSSKGVSDNKWHFVALAFDQSATGGAALYIDGKLDTTNSNGGSSWSWPTGEQPLEIGYTTDTIYRDYNGLLHDVLYFNTALTANQVNTLYQGTDPDAAALQLQLDFAAAPGTGYSLSWKEGSAVLQSSPTPTGPWVDIQGASSPFTIVPSATQQYFRYRYVPISQTSNPYLM